MKNCEDAPKETEKKELRRITKEDIEFFEGAISQFCFNEYKHMVELLDKLKLQEEDVEKEGDLEFREDIVEYLLGFVDIVENAKSNYYYLINLDIIRGGRFKEIVDLFFKTKYKSIKLKLGSVLSSMMQNEGYVQKAAIKNGIFDIMKVIDEEKDESLISKYIYLLASNNYFIN